MVGTLRFAHPTKPRQTDPTGKSIPIYVSRSSPEIKNISLLQKAKSAYITPIPSHSKGRRPSSRRGAGCDGRGGCEDDSWLTRTAKACGPDAPSWRQALV